MYLFLLAAIALALAAVLWYAEASGREQKPPPPPREPDAGARLRQALSEDGRIMSSITESIRALEALMAHPALGGPGFLLVQFPPQPPGCGYAAVTAQYPNIQEELYRRIVRQELDRDALTAAGMPAGLLAAGPVFETESGGIVLVSVQAGGLPPALEDCFHCRRDRDAALRLLAGLLEERFPNLSVRTFGTELLLSPMGKKEACAASPTSTGE